MMKKIILLFVLSLPVILVIVLVRTFFYPSLQVKTETVPHLEIGDEAIERFAQSLRIVTISWQEAEKFDSAAFDAFHVHLQTSFPLVDSLIERKVISDYSLLYIWKGSNPSLKPALFMAHQDVVPIDPLSINDWRHPPFDGVVDSGFVFGRGTIDIKSQLIGLLEAAEMLLQDGFQPQRTILFAFGHDEELGGYHGAREIAAYLKANNLHPEFIMDEGGAVLHGTVPGIPDDVPVAIIGIAEKGYVSFELTVEDAGGHSSMPPKNSAIGILSSAITKIENNPYPLELDGAGGLIFDFVGPEMTFPLNMFFANKWLFAPLIKKELNAKNSTRATMHTTTAVTVFHSGEKENVLPVKAKAIVNHRLMPGVNLELAQRRLQQVIADERVKVAVAERHEVNEATPVSDVTDTNFLLLQKTIAQIFPDAIAAPYLDVGGTDCKHYVELTNNIYRFQPSRLHDSDLKRIHGTDERLSVDSYKESVNFFRQIILNAGNSTH